MRDLPAVLDKLRRFDTPTICNVIELFEVRPRNQGFMDQRIRAAFAELPPMVGFACTAAFRSDQPPGKGDAYGSLQTQLEQFASLPGPGGSGISGPGRTGRWRDLRRSDVLDLQGLRFHRVDHQWRRSRSGTGARPGVSRVLRVRPSVPTPTVTSCTSDCPCVWAG